MTAIDLPFLYGTGHRRTDRPVPPRRDPRRGRSDPARQLADHRAHQEIGGLRAALDGDAGDTDAAAAERDALLAAYRAQFPSY